MRSGRKYTGRRISACLAAIAASCASANERETAFAIVQETERIAEERTLWPGFDPLAVPLAIYTGRHTWLFRHPAPPGDFSAVTEAELPAFAYEGRYPAVVADTVAEIGGLATATLMADRERQGQTFTSLVATAMHEAFHAYQRAEYPGWVPNIVDEFTYPTDDARLLGLRRLESAGLRRALAARDTETSQCWARYALALRDERFATLEPTASGYERMVELAEGTAFYVEFLAAGETSVDIPETGFAPTEVRQRAGISGAAFAFLLDRLKPGWQKLLSANDDRFLDQMLVSAVATGMSDHDADCHLSPEEATSMQRSAQVDIDHLAAERSVLRERFEAQSGWRIGVRTEGEQPLRPCGIDPVNIEHAEGGLVHTRWLCLQNEYGRLEMIDENDAHLGALTMAVGENPLFDGIHRVTIAGLPEPEVETGNKSVTVRAPGIDLRFAPAVISREGKAIEIQLAD